MRRRRAALRAAVAAGLLALAVPATSDEMPTIDADDSVASVMDSIREGPSEPAGAMSLQPGGLAPAAAEAATPPGGTRSIAGGGPAAPAPALPPVAPRVLIELYTSQGCAPCPPADALLADLAERADVLPLSLHVDYWDYLGWPDGFARPEFTARQQAYGRRNGERGVYTPQIIIGGVDTLIDAAPADLAALIRSHLREPAAVRVTSRREGERIVLDLAPGALPRGHAAVELVRYLPSRRVAIQGGENIGQTVSYTNIVLSFERLSEWDGRTPLRITVTPRAGMHEALPSDTRHAVLVQEYGRGGLPGKVLAAVTID
ncbi:thioredoxin family protein [Paracoccus sp. S-4012]|uniref:DUF1223 domain-containing protein n=1 Tax=Paracoccus sp. S-4012 TaxID=2665648 RepID=UPI0018A21249|nr:DUF1223 domain-containing protein [Paracoccus sp. S-4012]